MRRDALNNVFLKPKHPMFICFSCVIVPEEMQHSMRDQPNQLFLKRNTSSSSFSTRI
jgi:hypothetical protein